MKSGKWHMTEGIELPRKNQNARRKGNLQILGNIGTWHYQTSRNESKILKKSISEESENYSKKEKTTTLYQEPYQRDKYLGCLHRKIVGTILELDQRRTQTNGQENKKTNDHA